MFLSTTWYDLIATSACFHASIIVFEWGIVATGCHNNCTHETVDWEDSDEWHRIWYEKIDTNSNGEADETEHYEYHGKEGKSEYGEYDRN